jgi:hypothetical protein
MRFTGICFVLASLLSIAGCGDNNTAEGTDTSADTEALDQSARTRTLSCTLEYEAFAPAYVTGYASSFSSPFSDVKTNGASASDGAYTLRIDVNPKPPYNLNFGATLFDASTNLGIAYAVLPPPTAKGAYLFEMGGRIPTTQKTGYDGATHDFDHVRSYCSYK